MSNSGSSSHWHTASGAAARSASTISTRVGSPSALPTAATAAAASASIAGRTGDGQQPRSRGVITGSITANDTEPTGYISPPRYLGQPALVFDDPANIRSPFFLLAPGWAQWPLVFLATAATIIASQAVITGAF